MFFRTKIMVLMCLSIIAMSGCTSSGGSSTEGKSSDSTTKKEPVTLTLYTLAQSFTDDDFKRIIQEPVAKKYPHITLKMVEEKPGTSVESLLVTGDFPDLIYTNTDRIGDYHSAKAVIDLNGLIKQTTFDLGRFDSTTIQAIKVYADQGEQLGLPMSYNGAVIAYNQDIFDKYGVPYPKDGMTWDEMIELAKKLGGKLGNDPLIVIDPLALIGFATTFSPPYVDAKTGKAVLYNEEWKRLLETFRTIKQLPTLTYNGNRFERFMNNQDIALIPSYDNILYVADTAFKQGATIHWDYVSYPSFKERPGLGLGFDAKTLMISSTTKYQKEAFDVISILTSDEVQLMNTRLGRRSPLKDPKYKEAFGSDLEGLKGKNVSAFFKTTQAIKYPVTPEVRIVQKYLNLGTAALLQGTDVNTVLREAEEKANIEISSLRK